MVDVGKKLIGGLFGKGGDDDQPEPEPEPQPEEPEFNAVEVGKSLVSKFF